MGREGRKEGDDEKYIPRPSSYSSGAVSAAMTVQPVNAKPVSDFMSAFAFDSHNFHPPFPCRASLWTNEVRKGV